MCVSLPTLSYGSLYPVFRFIILSMIVIGIIIVFVHFTMIVTYPFHSWFRILCDFLIISYYDVILGLEIPLCFRFSSHVIY